MNKPERTFNKPYHEFNYPQMTYKNMTDDEIICEVLNMFKNGCSYIEPAMSYFIAIIYAFLMQKYYNINIFESLNNKNLLFSDRFFKPYDEKKYIYDTVLKNIVPIFFNTVYVPFEKIFKKEFQDYDSIIVEGAWIFPDNSIKYLGNNFLHYQYLCLLYNDEEFKKDVYYNDYNPTFLKKYINKGYIRLNCELNTIGLMFGNNSKYSQSIIKATKNLIKNDTLYLSNNLPIKFIIENIDTNEYEVLEEYSNYLGVIKFNKLIKEKMKK